MGGKSGRRETEKLVISRRKISKYIIYPLYYFPRHNNNITNNYVPGMKTNRTYLAVTQHLRFAAAAAAPGALDSGGVRAFRETFTAAAAAAVLPADVNSNENNIDRHLCASGLISVGWQTKCNFLRILFTDPAKAFRTRKTTGNFFHPSRPVPSRATPARIPHDSAKHRNDL